MLWAQRRAGMLRMSAPIRVHVIGAPVACEGGVKATWREVAGWAGQQLQQRFGETVQVRYSDLFDADCPSVPPGAELPLVLVNGEVLTSGGKISVPAVRRKIEAILEQASVR